MNNPLGKYETIGPSGPYVDQADSDIDDRFSKKEKSRGGSGTAATSKMERFVITVNYYHKALRLGCFSSPTSASEDTLTLREIKLLV